MLRRILPHPGLSLTLTLVWVGLVNNPSWNNLLLAVLLGLAIPKLTSVWWPDPPRLKLRALPLLIGYVGIVLYDVVVSSFAVARIVLFMPADQIRSTMIEVPTKLATPEAVALLAGTITMTPGTVTTDISDDGRFLLIHALHAPDPDAVRDDILNRYEARLKRIFA